MVPNSYTLLSVFIFLIISLREARAEKFSLVFWSIWRQGKKFWDFLTFSMERLHIQNVLPPTFLKSHLVSGKCWILNYPKPSEKKEVQAILKKVLIIRLSYWPIFYIYFYWYTYLLTHILFFSGKIFMAIYQYVDDC